MGVKDWVWGEGVTEIEDYFLSSGFIFLIKLRHMGGRVISRGRIGAHLWTHCVEVDCGQ